MTKRLILLIVATLWLLPSVAQISVEKLLFSMPNDMLWMDQSQRSDLLAYFKDKKVDSIQNGLNGYSRLIDYDETAKYLSIKTSPKGSFEFQLFNDENRSFVGVIFTTCAPACDSKVAFYSFDWKPYDLALPQVEASDFLLPNLSADNLALAHSLLTPLFVHYAFQKGTGSLIATCNAEQFLAESDWKQLKPMLKPESIRYLFQKGGWIAQK